MKITLFIFISCLLFKFILESFSYFLFSTFLFFCFKFLYLLKTEDIHPPKTGISVHFSGSLV